MAYPNETPFQGTGGTNEYGAPQVTTPVPATPPADAWTTQSRSDSTTDTAKDVAAHTGDRAKEAAGTVKDEAGAVAGTAKEAGGHVVETAKQEAAVVLEEAKFQGRRLLDESVSELRTQAGAGQHKVAALARELGSELKTISDADPDGMLSDYVNRAQRFTDDAAQWLDSRGPDELMAEVRRYAARKPWQFLAISAGVGFVGARLLRGLKDAESDDTNPTAPSTPRYDPSPVARRQSVVPEGTFIEPESRYEGLTAEGVDPWRQEQR